VRKTWRNFYKFYNALQTKKQFYSFILILIFIGFLWLGFHFIEWNPNQKIGYEVCLFKKITTLPCPSCGSTRAVFSIFKGEFLIALYLNPLGYLILFGMLIIPPWILLDLIQKKSSFFYFYQKTIKKISDPKIYVPLILLVLINWIWNLTKSL
jgi:hypothetical protein